MLKRDEYRAWGRAVLACLSVRLAFRTRNKGADDFSWGKVECATLIPSGGPS